MEHLNRAVLVLGLTLGCLVLLPAAVASEDKPGAALGEPCASEQTCLTGLRCRDGRCVREDVPAGGACDADQRCGKGLECRVGTCRSPCFCALPCTVSEKGRCEQSARPPCAKIDGKCKAAGCYVDAKGACVKDKNERRPCELNCP